MKGGAHPSLFAALAFPNSKKVPIYCWIEKESFPVIAWRSPASNSRHYGDFLHRNRAALTTRPRRLSTIYTIGFLNLLLTRIGVYIIRGQIVTHVVHVVKHMQDLLVAPCVLYKCIGALATLFNIFLLFMSCIQSRSLTVRKFEYSVENA